LTTGTHLTRLILTDSVNFTAILYNIAYQTSKQATRDSNIFLLELGQKQQLTKVGDELLIDRFVDAKATGLLYSKVA
jgi:hypothetical protein